MTLFPYIIVILLAVPIIYMAIVITKKIYKIFSTVGCGKTKHNQSLEMLNMPAYS